MSERERARKRTLFDRSSKSGFSREREKYPVRNTKPKWAARTVGADMAVELEADLNADPTNEFVIKGEKKGTGNERTCKCCQCGRNFTGHKRKLTVHIAGKKFLSAFMHSCGYDQAVRSICTQHGVICSSQESASASSEQALFKRACPLPYISSSCVWCDVEVETCNVTL